MNIPQLRFREFAEEWKEGRLGDYGTLINGLTYSPDNISDEGLLVLRSSNVQNGQIYLHDNVYVDLEVPDKALTKKDDILICVRNGSKRLIGKSTIIPEGLEKSTHGAFMSVFRGDSNNFISHWFQTKIYYKEVHKNLGATINSINGSDLKRFTTIFPSKSEEQKIASFLTSIDTKIAQLIKKERLLKKYKKGAIQKIFSQEIRFKDNSGNEYPDWVEKKLEELFLIASGKSKSKYINKSGKNIIVDMGGISSEPKLIAKKNTDYSDDYLTTKDLVMPKDDIGGGFIIGKVVEIPENNKYICGDHIYKLTINIGNITFLKYAINSYSVNKSFRQKANGTAQIGLNKKVVETQKVIFPCQEEQTKIANFLSSIDKIIESLAQQLNQTKEFKKALLQQMFV